MVVLWIAADWPVHDIAEDYLYSVHMVQHLLLTWVVPPMLLLATPEWLPRLVLGKGRAYRIFRFCTLPLVAGLAYNALFAFGHAPFVVYDYVKYSAFHFSMHFLLVIFALAMWNCVCGPLKELRISLPAQCIYLFIMSILPTVPGGWLVFAQHPVYHVYVHPWHSLWGLTPSDDQQLAGFIMKVIGGLYLWSIIVTLFFRWGQEQDALDVEARKARRIAREQAAAIEAEVAVRDLDAVVDPGALLTYQDVSAAFDRSSAPSEAVRKTPNGDREA
jgi:putative membrane protein